MKKVPPALSAAELLDARCVDESEFRQHLDPRISGQIDVDVASNRCRVDHCQMSFRRTPGGAVAVSARVASRPSTSLSASSLLPTALPTMRVWSCQDVCQAAPG